MKIKAPAKINLFLEITGKRPNGYHNLESVMHTIDLCDELELYPSDKVELECSCTTIGSLQDNLVFKTAIKLKEKYNVAQGVKIILNKNIPSGAGLGGGSSDAAATIVALNKFWKLGISLKDMENFAATLGADVPFFLTGGTAKIEGIGEIVTKIDVKDDYEFILVKPNFGVPTAKAYSKIKFPLTNVHKITKIIEVLKNSTLSKVLSKALFFNRFEETVFTDYPEIAKIKTVLENLEVPCLMSGSGATVFGLVSCKKQADEVAEKLKPYGWNIWYAKSFVNHTNPAVEE